MSKEKNEGSNARQLLYRGHLILSHLRFEPLSDEKS